MHLDTLIGGLQFKLSYSAELFAHPLRHSLSLYPNMPFCLLKGNVNLLRPIQVVGKGKGYLLLKGQRKWFQGNSQHKMGPEECSSNPQTYTPSACILTLHPVILPFPYLVFSRLVELTACILCFILHSPPCIVVGVCLCMFVYAWGLRHLETQQLFSLSSVCTSTETLKVELNGLKQSERGILE